MNEFALASGRSYTLELKYNKLNITQFKMHNIDEWSGCAKKIKDHLKSNNKDFQALMLNKALDKEILQLIQLNLGENYSFTDVMRILLQEADYAEQIIEAIVMMNAAYFEEKEKPKGVNADGSSDVDPKQKGSWFDAFQLLIAMGHQNSEIMQMTYGAFQGYLKAAQKERAQQIKNAAIAHRVSQASKKDFENFNKSLDKTT